MSSKKNIIRKSQPKKDIGNLNNKEFGVELDPNNNLCLAEDAEKGQQAYYKGSKMDYLDYIGEVGHRINQGKKGKGTSNLGTFAGFGKGTLKKPYKE
jgi:hypothetical protein|tara:strand:+ start:1193 stop:1483 length:291 start_codon:yes stop_codon:yes gene_type:complete